MRKLKVVVMQLSGGRKTLNQDLSCNVLERVRRLDVAEVVKEG